jgi:glycine cleavage system transcriptional repressor
MADEQRYIVFTAVGADRSGLVQHISRTIHEAGASIEDSRMAILGGEFALILLAAGSAEALGRVRDGRAALEERLGLAITLKDTTAATSGRRYLPYRLRVSGVDQPGIVSNISAILATHEVNVASLESRLQFAPLSGTPMFLLRAELQVPSELALSELRKTISDVCDAENLDFQLEPGSANV